MRRLLLLLVVLGLLALSAPATAQSPIVIELMGIMGRPEGTIELLTSEPVDPSLVGRTCEGVAQTENNASVHPDNNVIIETGTTSATFFGVEDAPGLIIPASGPVVLGNTIDVYFEWGPDEITSLGIIITITCAPPATTTTTTTTTEPPPETTTTTTTTTTTMPTTSSTLPEEPTTTTSTTTTTSSTTTTSPPPTGVLDLGGGGAALGTTPTAPPVQPGEFALVVLGVAGMALAGAGATAAWRRRSQS